MEMPKAGSGCFEAGNVTNQTWREDIRYLGGRSIVKVEEANVKDLWTREIRRSSITEHAGNGEL
jgi:hypothetical protein